MKKLMILIMCLLLAGCTPKQNIQEQLDASLNTALSLEANKPQRTKDIISYYHEPKVGILDTTQTSTVFLSEGAKFVMNVDISSIINQSYYQSAEKSSLTIDPTLMVAENTGNLINFKGESIPYTCRVYQLEDYYVIFETPEVNFYGRGSQTQASIMAYDMCNIAKTLLLEKEVLLARYSSKEMIVSSKEELTLFETIVPVNGRVDEILQSYEIEETYQNHEDIDFDHYATDEFNEEELMP